MWLPATRHHHIVIIAGVGHEMSHGSLSLSLSLSLSSTVDLILLDISSNINIFNIATTKQVVLLDLLKYQYPFFF